MESKEVSHKSDVSHVEIYERLVKVEEKVDKLTTDTEGMVQAFNDAQGVPPQYFLYVPGSFHP